MKAVKLPSGKWRIRVYLGEVDGKKKWKSITAGTKKEAQLQAFKYEQGNNSAEATKTMSQLCEDYIKLKEAVLSPSTISGYTFYLKRINASRFGKLKAISVRNQDMQAFVSELSKDKSPKTVRNIYGLVTASLNMYLPNEKFNVRLPQKIKVQNTAPSNDDVKKVIDYFRNSGDNAMLIASLLATCTSMRRGEICAAEVDDVKDGTITISKDMVRSKYGYVIKNSPKTSASFRTIPIPQSIIDIMPASGRLVPLHPEALSSRFQSAVKACGVKMRFHDLRHYFATVMMYSGVPARIVQSIGGWETDRVMKDVYLGVQQDEQKKQMERMSAIWEASGML